MRNLNFSGQIFGESLNLQQTSKPTAKKLYLAGERIFIQSSNFLPFNIWSTAHEITKGSDFDDYIKCFEYYNCSSEQGRYVTFYKTV